MDTASAIGQTVNTNDCIEWDRCRDNKGYGRIGPAYRLVHRLVWEEERGEGEDTMILTLTLKVILLTASILKIVDPSPDGPLYVFRDPACKLVAGEIVVYVEDLLPPDPTARVGTLEQGGVTCDVYEVVYPGV